MSSKLWTEIQSEIDKKKVHETDFVLLDKDTQNANSKKKKIF